MRVSQLMSGAISCLITAASMAAPPLLQSLGSTNVNNAAKERGSSISATYSSCCDFPTRQVELKGEEVYDPDTGKYDRSQLSIRESTWNLTDSGFSWAQRVLTCPVSRSALRFSPEQFTIAPVVLDPSSASCVVTSESLDCNWTSGCTGGFWPFANAVPVEAILLNPKVTYRSQGVTTWEYHDTGTRWQGQCVSYSASGFRNGGLSVDGEYFSMGESSTGSAGGSGAHRNCTDIQTATP